MVLLAETGASRPRYHGHNDHKKAPPNGRASVLGWYCPGWNYCGITLVALGPFGPRSVLKVTC